MSTIEGARIRLAQIQKVELENNVRIAETILERVTISQEFLLVPVSNALRILSLVHDYLSEGCRVTERRVFKCLC